MKQHLIRILGVAALVLPLSAWAQDSSLEVTMEVVPFAGHLDQTKIIEFDADASPDSEGVANSTFGRTTAGNAQAGGRDFGAMVSGVANANEGQPGFTIPKPPAQ